MILGKIIAPICNTFAQANIKNPRKVSAAHASTKTKSSEKSSTVESKTVGK